IIVAVEAFRRTDSEMALDRKSGTGGFALIAESILPVVHDLNSPQGREASNLPGLQDPAMASVAFWRFRVRSGDDASCLNLYRPQDPQILAPTADFLHAGRFGFSESLASTAAQKENPWL